MRPALIELIQNQHDTYENIFKKNPDSFHQPTFHYDWWMFPQNVPANINVSSTSRKFAIDDADTKELLQHPQFISDYHNSVEQYLNNLQKFGWNHYDIRYAKMLHSLSQFIKISNHLSSDQKMADINLKLKALANTAVDFANTHIKDGSSLLKNGKSALQDLLKLETKVPVKKDTDPQTSITPKQNPPNKSSGVALLSATALMTVIAIITMFKLPLLWIAIAIVPAAIAFAWDNFINNDSNVANGQAFPKKLKQRSMSDKENGRALKMNVSFTPLQIQQQQRNKNARLSPMNAKIHRRAYRMRLH